MKKNGPGKIFIIIISCLIAFEISPFIGSIMFITFIVRICKNAKNNITSAHTSNINVTNKVINSVINGIELKCPKCGTSLQSTDKHCNHCGMPFTGDNVVVTEINEPPKTFVSYRNFAPIYRLPEDEMVERFIKKELTKAKIKGNNKLIPLDILKRKKIFNIILSVLLFIYICLVFFHFPIFTYIIGGVLLFVFYKLTRNFNMMKYLKKQLKSRPSEKISNIIMNMKTNLTADNSKKTLVIGMCTAIILPMLIFIKPVILYEKVDDGYAVRYYAFGVTNFTSATIPETHNGKNVVGLRGNTFSNMFFLSKVTLPDTITEIRGQAFKNTSIKEIKLPTNLVYLGGGVFYNCRSLKSIEIPDSVTYIGGEAFRNAFSLEKVKLSNQITEIKGSTFENCSSLESIVIPDSVTRIGGHAFYDCSSLSEVTFTKYSNLNEIGSSAFRKCSRLYTIYLPSDVSVNSRAFKESPTEIRYYTTPINYN